jgi:hypothetical protein
MASFKFLFLLFACIVVANSIVVFEAYGDALCTTRIWAPGSRRYLPITDRIQGIDSQVAAQIYGGNPPASVGTWKSVTSAVATLCKAASCQSWNIPAVRNATECRLVPSFGYGRFYNVPSPVAIELWRTTGQATTPYCGDPAVYQWVAYAELVSADTDACATTGTQVFWDGKTKLSYFKAGASAWTGSQPCGSPPYPGSKCATGGQLYCSPNDNCAIDHVGSPKQFPWFGAYATTVKITTGNFVGNSTTSSGPKLYMSIAIVYICILLVNIV